MADLIAIRNAIAAAISNGTGMRAFGQAHDSVTPPCAVVLPGQPLITYGDTMDSPVMGSPGSFRGAVTINLVILLIMSDAPLVEQTQRALDTYLGVGGTPGTSVPDAIEADQNLGGTVHWVQCVSAGRYGRLEYSAITYFGAAVSVSIGAM
jgi:hypothetical protein